MATSTADARGARPDARPQPADTQAPFTVAAPPLALPKGGGTIRGMGEKFAANPVTGTGSMSVPIATSPGRSGFGPQLSLAYDSGAGNGPFGFGWSLSLPAITRKTDKGLPQYLDAEDSDVFILAGSEDLVPVYRQDADGSWVAAHPGHRRDKAGHWVRDAAGRLLVHEDEIDGYRVRRYRPRVEGLFASIERWSRIGDCADVHWRSISKDNVLTLYGRDANARIADPQDARRIFTWLICESRDDKGNAVRYLYKAEDGAGALGPSAQATCEPVDRAAREAAHQSTRQAAREATRQPPSQVAHQPAHQRHRGRADDARRGAQRYLQRVLYGNRRPLLDAQGQRPHDLAELPNPSDTAADWLFEVRLDYGELDADDPLGQPERPWPHRADAFSSYRSGFEIRTCRRCERVLMLHHIPDTPAHEGRAAQEGYRGVVRSTEFIYGDEVDPARADRPVYTFLMQVTQSGWNQQGGALARRSLPPLSFGYTEPSVQDRVEEIDAASLENLPIGLDGNVYRWTDLHGEGTPGILTEQGGAWFYKRNWSPLSGAAAEGGRERVRACVAPLEAVALRPNAALGAGAEVMDLAGDGQPDVVVLDGPAPGLYEHDEAGGWQPWRPFSSHLSRNPGDPNLRFIDLDGDGRADVLITEDQAFVWHASLAEQGFGPARRVAQALDEEQGPRVVFADGTQSVYLADLSGDGLTDIVRIRNGEVCYWPNLGYGRFGAKITMDNAPWFDSAEQFDQRRIRLADIDGSGTTDILYLHRDGVRLYFNQSGNGWSRPQTLAVCPRIDELVNVMPVDLLGNGTACLVWSSPLPADAGRPMRYVRLMGDTKPHLLVRASNNLGAETHIDYAPSTKFYLQDQREGRPWIARLPFPVHVVERVLTHDLVSRNRFASRYAYHHGHYDGEEREFRGFGMVEQWDSEEMAALTDGHGAPEGPAAAYHVPAVHTKTWFHTGVHLGRERVSRHFEGEYFRESGLDAEAARAQLLADTLIPRGLDLDTERQLCRALKGAMLRQEIYADDAAHAGATAAQVQRARTPYSVVEQNFGARVLQPRGSGRYAVVFTHASEVLSSHYERNPNDPRVQHALTLAVDDFGNVLAQASIGYGRRTQLRVLDAQGHWRMVPNPGLPEAEADRAHQTTALLTYTENRVTNAVLTPHARRNPQPCETSTFELTGYTATGPDGRFQASDLVQPDPVDGKRTRLRFDAEIAYEASAAGPRRRRPIERLRTLYRRDDLSALLPLGQLQALALPGESYKLAFTPGLLAQVFQRPRQGQDAEPLLPDPAAVLGGQGGSQGGYVCSQALVARGLFPAGDADDHWWIPSGLTFYSADAGDDTATEAAHARAHFFLPRRWRDPFGHEACVDFDAHALAMSESRDALGNRVTVDVNDYRVLQPRCISDPNRNRAAVAFDALGLVVGSALMGKPAPAPVEGDTLEGFDADLDPARIGAFFDAADPHAHAAALLGGASTRIVYDLDRFRRSAQAHPDDPTRWQPAGAATLARETHVSAPQPPQGSKIQLSFSYSDGLGQEVQKKVQAEAGPLDVNDPQSPTVARRWVGSGWTIFNNKGKPVRQYEAFFCATPAFEFGVMAGVSPVLFYDPADRVVATLHPNHTFEKVVFDAWQQTTYDVNDTCAPAPARGGARAGAHGGDPRGPAQTGDPRTDADIGGIVALYFQTQRASWQTWHAQRIDGALGAHEQQAAQRAAAHADTPTTVHFDVLGRPFLTVARNRVVCPGHPLDGSQAQFSARVELDIEGQQRAVRDAIQPAGEALGRVVMRYAYDMLGNRIHQLNMEAGARWVLSDATGKPIRAWDSRGHDFTSTYDALRRQLEQHVRGSGPACDPRTLGQDILADRIEYGETVADAEGLNLRGRVYRHCDGSGVLINARLDAAGQPSEAYDFKGNLLHGTRRLVSDYRTIPDWRRDPRLDDETFETSTRYDALNRPVQLLAPRNSTGAGGCNVVQNAFNEAGLLECVHVWLERAEEPSALLDPAVDAPAPVGVADIDYDAKGQRLRMAYKNGAATHYRYDPLTLRLLRLQTRRPAQGFAGDDPQPALAGWPGKQLQNLHYTYDPAGNITHVRDDAQQAVYFRNRRVEPSNDYVYDALYRLVQASGREHLGKGGAPTAHAHADAGRVGTSSADAAARFAPNDGQAMGTYIERYVHDAVGNFLQMQHRGSDPAHAGWTRSYEYLEASLIDGGDGTPPPPSNRLSRSTLQAAGGGVQLETYLHDAHGNMVRMPHLGGGAPGPNLHWDYKDQLQRTELGGGGTAYFVYDASGQRVRKVWEKAPGCVEERLYLGGFEIHRRHGGAIGNASAVLERQTLHVMDGQERIALVETRTLDAAGDDRAPRQLIRYQHANHLGSASLELDEQAQIISYEEYAPYGSTTYQAVRSQTETAKRYRYTGKERDAESGLYYHGARYYAPWLGRWTSVDPGLIAAREGQPVDQTYQYAACRPIVAADPDGRVIWFAVIGIVAIATVTITSDANAPTGEEEARRAKPSVSNSEFAARTAVVGVSWFAGGGVGDKILLGTGSKILSSAGGGAFGGAVGAPGDLFVSDLFRGEFSSGGTYLSHTAGGIFGGALIGGGLGGISRVARGPATPPPGGFGWHNVFGVPGMRPGRSADIAEMFEARFGEAPEGMYVVGSRAEAYKAGKWPEGSGPAKSDIDLVIQSDVPDVTKWILEGFEFLKEINPGRVPPEVTGIGVRPGKTFIGSEPGNIPKSGLVDPFIGPKTVYPDLSLGPAIKVWPPAPSPPPQLRALAERIAGPIAGPIVGHFLDSLWGSKPQPAPAPH